MKEIHSDINIIGGGLIGLSTALSLSNLGYKITVIEKKGVINAKNHKDTRTIAISEGTKKFLQHINLWQNLKKFAQPINKIKVIDRNLTNKLEFDNNRRKSNLGYIIKNIHVLNALNKKLKNNTEVLILNNSNIKNFQFNKDSITTELNNKAIISHLNIAADGKNSFVKKILKTPSFSKNYNKSALVINFNHSLDHRSTAFEFFYKNGPLAILPMLKENNKYFSSIVWTNNKNYLNNIIQLEDNKIISILEKYTQKCVGDIEKIFSKQTFPITAHLNTRFQETRTIYIGDAAHSFHPIAGQGWNLGMKDVENLFFLIKKYKSLGINLGGKNFCKEYQNENFYNAYRLYQLTDKLDKIFKISNPAFKLARIYGLNYLQNNKRINNLISDFAMGVN